MEIPFSKTSVLYNVGGAGFITYVKSADLVLKSLQNRSGTPRDHSKQKQPWLSGVQRT